MSIYEKEDNSKLYVIYWSLEAAVHVTFNSMYSCVKVMERCIRKVFWYSGIQSIFCLTALPFRFLLFHLHACECFYAVHILL